MKKIGFLLKGFVTLALTGLLFASCAGGISDPVDLQSFIDASGSTVNLSDGEFVLNENESIVLYGAQSITGGDSKFDMKGAVITVKAAGVNLSNLTNVSEIIVASEVGDGDFTLNGSDVTKLTVNGGGANSVHINNAVVASVSVSKEGVRIVLEGATTVAALEIKANCALDKGEGSTAVVASLTVADSVTEIEFKATITITNVEKIPATVTIEAPEGVTVPESVTTAKEKAAAGDEEKNDTDPADPNSNTIPTAMLGTWKSVAKCIDILENAQQPENPHIRGYVKVTINSNNTMLYKCVYLETIMNNQVQFHKNSYVEYNMKYTYANSVLTATVVSGTNCNEGDIVDIPSEVLTGAYSQPIPFNCSISNGQLVMSNLLTNLQTNLTFEKIQVNSSNVVNSTVKQEQHYGNLMSARTDDEGIRITVNLTQDNLNDLLSTMGLSSGYWVSEYSNCNVLNEETHINMSPEGRPRLFHPAEGSNPVHTEPDTVELIFPFVEKGKEYTFTYHYGIKVTNGTEEKEHFGEQSLKITSDVTNLKYSDYFNDSYNPASVLISADDKGIMKIENDSVQNFFKDERMCGTIFISGGICSGTSDWMDTDWISWWNIDPRGGASSDPHMLPYNNVFSSSGLDISDYISTIISEDSSIKDKFINRGNKYWVNASLHFRLQDYSKYEYYIDYKNVQPGSEAIVPVSIMYPDVNSANLEYADVKFGSYNQNATYSGCIVTWPKGYNYTETNCGWDLIGKNLSAYKKVRITVAAHTTDGNIQGLAITMRDKYDRCFAYDTFTNPVDGTGYIEADLGCKGASWSSENEEHPDEATPVDLSGGLKIYIHPQGPYEESKILSKNLTTVISKIEFLTE